MTDLKPLVLLAEDEPQMRTFVRLALIAHGYRVLEVETGREALQQAAAHTPDLVLLDLGLPDMDGLDVTRGLREWSATPIIIISARGQEREKVEALDVGADDYLTKPFGSAELMARVRVALRHAARAAQDPLTSGRLDRRSQDRLREALSCLRRGRRGSISPPSNTSCSWRSPSTPEW